MFERVTFKLNAKKTLYGNWKVPILVTLVNLVVSLIFKAPQIYYRFAYGDGYVSVSSPIFTLLSVIATGIISYASTVFYLCFAENPKTSFLTFLDALNYWLRGVLTLLWQTLWIFLWSLCFIIPGIVKVISYSQMFYLLAEYPKMGINRAMKISMETGAKVVPVLLRGTRERLEEKGEIVPGEIDVVFLPSIETKGLSRDEFFEMPPKIRQLIKTENENFLKTK